MDYFDNDLYVGAHLSNEKYKLVMTKRYQLNITNFPKLKVKNREIGKKKSSDEKSFVEDNKC